MNEKIVTVLCPLCGPTPADAAASARILSRMRSAANGNNPLGPIATCPKCLREVDRLRVVEEGAR